MKPEIILITQDHPEAVGRKVRVGETGYILRFPLNDGRELVLKCGEQGIQTLSNLMIDIFSGSASYSDGSTNE